jgi:hypothetical protein
MNKIVWQPRAIYQPTYNFGIVVKRDFAEEMINCHISDEKRKWLNKLGEDAIKKLGHNNPNPYHFDEKNAFVRDFSLGENGVWLELDRCFGKSPLEVYDEDIPFSSCSVRY